MIKKGLLNGHQGSKLSLIGFRADVYDEGDLHLARGSQDPNAVAEPNLDMEDAGAIEMAEDSNFDQGDYDLLKGCQDPGVEEINHQFGMHAIFCLRTETTKTCTLLTSDNHGARRMG